MSKATRTAEIPAAFPAGKLNFDPGLPWLAPLAGYSDLPFRTLCREYGAAVAETEMVSAKGLLYDSPGTVPLLKSHSADQPLIVQLFGGEPASMSEALLRLRRHGYALFDCNMGCPVRKVFRQGAGAALISDFPRAMAIARAMLAACSAIAADMPESPAIMGFKLRLSPEGLQKTLDLALALQDAGAAWITIHPRTAAQGYGGEAQWDIVGRVVEALHIPVVASGDLFTAEAGSNCLRQTGAAAAMYARGALRDPLIFAKHRQLWTSEGSENRDCASYPSLIEVVKHHVALARQHGDGRRAFVKMRSIIPRYAKHLPGINDFRLRLIACQNWEELEPVLNEFIANGDDNGGT